MCDGLVVCGGRGLELNGITISVSLRRLLAIAALLCVELVAFAVAYQMLVSFECQATEAQGACRFLRSFVARALSVIAALSVMLWARPSSLDPLSDAMARPAAPQWPLLHALGLILMLAPAVLAAGRSPDAFLQMAVGPWLLGAACAGAGALCWLAPPGAWWSWLRADGGRPLLIAGLAFFLPDLAEAVQPIWDSSVLTRVTFLGVERTLFLFSPATVSDPAGYVIGVDDFFVHIARQCSGVEGFALVTGFVFLYAYLFREQLRFPRFWFVVLPLGLALSWVLNVLRIAALILLGARVSPELAVNGFHSYAGWLFFTLLALGMLVGIQATPWLRRQAPRGAHPRLRSDWTAARILPFVAFMMASVAASALSSPPDLAYPIKALAMAAALAIFHEAYRRVGVSLDPLAIGLGVLVGLGWIAAQPPSGPDDAQLALALADLGAVAFAFWAAVRLVGTVLLVPWVEELFFRGYVLARLDSGGLAARVLALIVSTALFAALHGRWLEAGLAGVVFGLLMLRRGRLADAITAHVAANLVMALWAGFNGNWGAM